MGCRCTLEILEPEENGQIKIQSVTIFIYFVLLDLYNFAQSLCETKGYVPAMNQMCSCSDRCSANIDRFTVLRSSSVITTFTTNNFHIMSDVFRACLFKPALMITRTYVV